MKDTQAGPILNFDELRRKAMQSMNQGAVTEDYPLDLVEACKLLNGALASEILCVLRYRHHQVTAKGIDYPQVAAEFKEHAEEEERHMMMIAERIDQLGGDPDFNPANVTKNTPTEYGSADNLREMIRDDLYNERIAIEVYRKLVAWFDKDATTRRMLEEILEDEEDHANDMNDLLATIGPEQKLN